MSALVVGTVVIGASNAWSATPAFVSASSAASSANATTLTLNRPVGAGAGHVLVATVAVRVPTAVAAPPGWTSVLQTTCSSSSTHITQAVFVRAASVAEPATYAFATATATGAAGTVAAYSGVDSAQPVDAAGGQSSRNSRWVGAPSITTTVPGALLVAGLSTPARAAIPTPPGMAARGDAQTASAADPARLVVSDQLFAGPGATGDRSSQTSGRNTCAVGQLVALRPGPEPPVNTAPPDVAGTPREGMTLTATPGSWANAPTSFAYRWQRDGVDIEGAISSSYVLTAADVGAQVRAVVTAANSGGAASAASAPTAPVESAGPPVNVSPPTVAGVAQHGETLTATEGVWNGSPTAFAYRWQRGGVDIPGATGAAYVLAADDVGSTLRVVVTASNPGGSTDAASAPTAAVAAATPPESVTPPVVSGPAMLGATLTASTGSWSGPPATYAIQWQSSPDGSAWSDLPATGTTYVLGAADVGTRLRVMVTATNVGGSTAVSSGATETVVPGPPIGVAPPVVTGQTVEGGGLTVSTGTWTGDPTSFAYQWHRCDPSGANCIAVWWATGSAFPLRAEDVGLTLRVDVTASNAGGSATASAGPTTVVLPLPAVNDELPTVTGVVALGEILTATAGDWESSAPVTYAYRWQRSDDGASWADVPGALGPAYQLLAGDIGLRLRVVVTATNAGGSAEAASEPTPPVAGAGAPTSIQLPQLSGTVQPGRPLSAAPGIWSGSPTGFTYQWQRSLDGGATWTDLTGQTTTRLQLNAGHVGAAVRVVVAAANGLGTGTAASEPVTIQPTTGVAATVNATWYCTTNVNLELVKVTITDGANRDAVRFDDCSGRIGRVEVDTNGADGLKVRNNGNVAHDLVVEEGYVRCTGHPEGIHQDGIQGMGGFRLTFRNLVFWCGDLTAEHGEGFVSSALLGTGGAGVSIPTDVVIEHSVMGMGNAQGVHVGESVRNGLRNSVACPDRTPENGPVSFNFDAVAGIDEGNEKPTADDPRCTSFEAAAAWAWN